MPGLSSALAIAVGALQAEQGALDVTTNNVANTNTPGYSRQVPDFVENPPIVLGTLTVGAGVDLQKIESLRDQILQVQIAQETQQQGQLNSLVTALQQAQTLFTSSTADIGTQISNFFSSLGQLSTNPTNLALRQGVLTAAGNLANAFHTTADNLTQQKTNLDLSVVENVQQVNTLTTQIASLNAQIANLQNTNHDASAFVDQRDVLIGQLSSLIDVSTIHSDNTLTLTTSNGTALVAGDRSFTLTTQTDASGVQHIFAQGRKRDLD
jgi:flagellar hook-associated protein 1 FlgK